MNKKLFFTVALALLFSCSEKTKEIEIGKPILEINIDFVNVTDSIEKKENLIHFQYQNLTAWGGIEVWYRDNEIVKTEATQTNELGFASKQIHFYGIDSISSNKSIEIISEKDLLEFNAKFDQIYKVGPNKIISMEGINETYVYNSYLSPFELRMQKDRMEIFNFISNKNKLIP